MKFLAILITIINSTAVASTLVCQISEQVGGKNYEQEAKVDFINKAGVAEIVSNFGKIHFSLMDDLITVTTLDPKLKKLIAAQFGAAEGDSSRLQIIPDEKSNDYLMMDCQMDGQGVATNPKGALCSLTETVGAQSFVTKFEVPLAQNGHDFTELPRAKIAPLGGWVMMYNGLLVTFIQNKDVYTGITTMGYWDKPVSVSWQPSPQNIRAEVSCIPNN